LRKWFGDDPECWGEFRRSQLTPAANDDEVGKMLEERLTAAKLEIAGLEGEDSYGKTPKPN
jgi:hypothetical protein